MLVKELIKQLQELPQDIPVCMADFCEVTKAVQVNYGNGVVVITDEEECEEE